MKVIGFLIVFKNGKKYVHTIPVDVSLNTLIKIVVKYVEDKRVSIIDAAKALLEQKNISGDVAFRWHCSYLKDANTIEVDIDKI